VGVGDEAMVAVGKGEAVGVGKSDWQAARKMRQPMTSFFMVLIKT
jgi:hypothetical protein